jgi:aspartate/methionine/tyrosine aminotransferase
MYCCSLCEILKHCFYRQISSTTQLWAKEMLERQHINGELWVSAFRRENHTRLERRSLQLCTVLDECGIPYLTPNSGLFVWLDLSRYLSHDAQLRTEDKERDLYLNLVHEFGLLLTPGLSMRNEQPGFFRCVYTAATDDEFLVSLDRFRNFARIKNQ